MARVYYFFIAVFLGTCSLWANQFPAAPLVNASFSEEYIKKLNIPPVIDFWSPMTIGLNLTDEHCNNMAPYLAYSIIQKHDTAILSKSAIPESLWKELQLFGSRSLLQTLKRTETHYGTAVLAHLLSDPVGVSSIAQRQKVVAHLLSASDYKKLRDCLQRIHAGEKQLVRWYTHLGIAKFFPNFTLAQIPSGVALLMEGILGTCGAFTLWLALKSREPLPFCVSGTSFLGAALYHCIFNGHQKFLRSTQAVLMGLAQIIEQADQIAQIIRNNPTLLEFPEFQEFLSVFDDSQQPKHLKELIQLLQTNTFKGSPSYWSRDSNILQARIHLIQSHNEIKTLLRGVGTVDAYTSLATLMRNHQDTNCPYTFVQFVDDEKPMLSLKNTWSPLTTDPLPISLECGRSRPQHTLVTGNNENVIKTIGVCTLLAHTFGIAPAQEATMSHFSLFHLCRTSDQYGLSDRLATITIPQEHVLVLYQEDKDVVFDSFIKIVAPQLAQSEQYMVIAAANNPQALDLTKMGFGNLQITEPQTPAETMD